MDERSSSVLSVGSNSGSLHAHVALSTREIIKVSCRKDLIFASPCFRRSAFGVASEVKHQMAAGPSVSYVAPENCVVARLNCLLACDLSSWFQRFQPACQSYVAEKWSILGILGGNRHSGG